MRNTLMWLAPLFLVIMLMASAVACSQPSSDQTTPPKPILTVTKGSVSKNFTMEDLKAMPTTEWAGCLRKENGPIEGPFVGKGVEILQLCNTVGGLQPGESAQAMMKDGFTELIYNNIVERQFKTYDTKTGKECPPPDNVIALLAYEQDGKPLVGDFAPLRLMILAGENKATHGYLWLGGITKVEIHKWEGLQDIDE